MASRFIRDNSVLVLQEFPFPRPPLTSNRDMDEARKLIFKIAQAIDLIIYYYFYIFK